MYKKKNTGEFRPVTEVQVKKILNKEGKFTVKKTGVGFWESLSVYHILVSISWTKFVILFFLIYILLNTFFGFIYLLIGIESIGISKSNSIFIDFLNAFFFSSQTLTTVGYGRENPISLGAEIVSSLEGFSSRMFVAISTGLLFVRFSRPNPKIEFSEFAIIKKSDNFFVFEFRTVNKLKTEIINAQISLIISKQERTEGKQHKKFIFMEPEREKITYFSTIWSLSHIIDEKSPLFGMTPDDMQEKDVELIVSLQGYDESYRQIVHTKHSYKYNEILWNVEFDDCISFDEELNAIIHIDKLSHIKKI